MRILYLLTAQYLHCYIHSDTTLFEPCVLYMIYLLCVCAECFRDTTHRLKSIKHVAIYDENRPTIKIVQNSILYKYLQTVIEQLEFVFLHWKWISLLDLLATINLQTIEFISLQYTSCDNILYYRLLLLQR